MRRRVTLAFKDKWWSARLERINPSRADLGFLFGQGVPVSVWWTDEPSDAAMLTGWIGGPKAVEMEKLENEQLIDIAVTSLSRIFSIGERLSRLSSSTALRTTGMRTHLRAEHTLTWASGEPTPRSDWRSR